MDENGTGSILIILICFLAGLVREYLVQTLIKVDTYIICDTDDIDEAAEYNSRATINHTGGVTSHERTKESIGAEGGG